MSKKKFHDTDIIGLKTPKPRGLSQLLGPRAQEVIPTGKFSGRLVPRTPPLCREFQGSIMEKLSQTPRTPNGYHRKEEKILRHFAITE